MMSCKNVCLITAYKIFLKCSKWCERSCIHHIKKSGAQQWFYHYTCITLSYYAEMKLTSVLLKVWLCTVAVGRVEQRYSLDDEWHPECAFHLICSVLQFTDGSPFILLAPNSYNWISKCMGPHIRAGPCWEGIWAALLAGRECVCRVHQSLPSPGELNKLIGRLVAASSRHCGPYSSQHRA